MMVDCIFYVFLSGKWKWKIRFGNVGGERTLENAERPGEQSMIAILQPRL